MFGLASKDRKKVNCHSTLPMCLRFSFLIEGFLCSLAGKESVCNARDLGLIPGLGRSPGEGKGYPLQYSGLENSMDLYSPWGHRESDVTE